MGKIMVRKKANVTEKIYFVLLLFLLTIPFKVFSSGEVLNVEQVASGTLPFIVSKGRRFDICNDVAVYINRHRAFYDNNPRELFSIKEGKISKPKSKTETVERYIQIALQNIAYNPIQLTGYRTSWKNRITFMEERIQQDFSVVELTIDINNDGITDRVLSYSYYNNEYKFWGHVNTVIDGDGNVNLSFSKGRITTGELFYYDGRTFSYRRNDQTNKVYEYFPSYKDMSEKSAAPNNMNGLLKNPAICEITLKK